MKRIVLVGLAFLLLCPVMVNAADLEKIKIAVASCDKTEKASVSNKAAKCPYYLMFDSKGEMTEVIDNPYGDASKMINTLKNKGITHFEFKGRVDDAVKRVLK